MWRKGIGVLSGKQRKLAQGGNRASVNIEIDAEGSSLGNRLNRSEIPATLKFLLVALKITAWHGLQIGPVGPFWAGTHS